MKNLLLFILLPLSFVAFSQTATFNDNLFDCTQISISVIKKSNYYLLIFKQDEETSKDSIYNWEKPIIENTFNTEFQTISDKNKVLSEANRIFYKYKSYVILEESENSKLIAGTMGFENKTVYLSIQKDIAKQYKKKLQEAIKSYKKQDNKTSESKHGQFIVYKKQHFLSRRMMIDTILSPKHKYPKQKLKKLGIKSQEEYLNQTVVKIYDTYFKKIKVLESKSKEVQTLITRNSNEKKELQNQLVVLNSLDSLIKNTKEENCINLKNELGVIIYNSKEVLKIKIDEHPKNSIFISQLSLLEKIDKINVESTLDAIFAKRENKTVYDTSKKIMINLITAQKDELSQKILDENINLKKLIFQQFNLLSESKTAANTLIGKEKSSIYRFNIDSIKIEINKTFIDNLVVYGTVEYLNFQKNSPFNELQKHVTLRNITPIGISTLNALDVNNKRVNLYAYINKKRYTIPLYEILSFYRPELKNYRRDFSPADTVYTVVKDGSLQTSALKKKSSGELFEFKVFSDFVGIDGTSSNGLVQTEFSKEMYLNPYRYLISKNQKHSAYFGFGSYIEPSFILSKIEETNKYYNLEYNDNKAYITTLALKRYEIYKVGFDVNLVSLTLPFLKSNLYIDPGLYFGRTGVSDSTYSINDSVVTINKQGVNSYTLSGNIKYVVQTDERYFFEIIGFYQVTNLLDDKINQSANVGNYTKTSFCERSMSGIEFFAGYSPSSNLNGKLFFRYRYTYAPGSKTGYNQLQIGYSYYFKK